MRSWDADATDMSASFGWWVIPGALILVSGVAQLDQVSVEAVPEVEPAAQRQIMSTKVTTGAATQVPEVAMFRTAAGDLEPLAFGAAARHQSLILLFPQTAVGERLTVTLWQSGAGERGVAPWICMQPVVTGDSTISIAGLIRGYYDLEVTQPGAAPSLVNRVHVPGEVRLALSTAAR